MFLKMLFQANRINFDRSDEFFANFHARKFGFSILFKGFEITLINGAHKMALSVDYTS